MDTIIAIVNRWLSGIKTDAQRRGANFLKHEGASSVADQVLEIAIGLILIGGVEVLGINMIINASTTNWDPNVKVMFQVILVILAIIADVYIFMNVAKRGKKT